MPEDEYTDQYIEDPEAILEKKIKERSISAALGTGATFSMIKTLLDSEMGDRAAEATEIAASNPEKSLKAMEYFNEYAAQNPKYTAFAGATALIGGLTGVTARNLANELKDEYLE